MEMPDGLPERMCEGMKIERCKQKYVCEIQRALYGLKVSPKRWFIRFRECMRKMQFETHPFQSCLFMWRKGAKFAILLLYVDDILIATNSKSKLNDTKSELAKEFEMTDLGTPKKFLGIEIIRDRANGTIFLHQRKFINSILK